MSRIPVNYLVFVFCLLMFFGKAQAADIKVNDSAPPFTLVDQYNKTHQLADYKGKWLVLYFYPKDDTPGCTTEACHFRDDIYKIRALGAEIIGISVDSTESHTKFSEKYGLPFPLLADTDGQVAKSYGSIWSLGPIKVAKRHTFIISPDGKIARIYRDVKPAEHSAQIIHDLESLQKST